MPAPMPRLPLRLLPAAALALALTSPQPAEASDAAAGLAPVGATLVLFGLGGGTITSILLGQSIADDQPVHPAVRNIGFAAGGVNLALGIAGITTAALIDDNDYDAVIYSVGGIFAALGLTGLGLAWAADEYTPTGQGMLVPAVGPDDVGLVWIGRF